MTGCMDGQGGFCTEQNHTAKPNFMLSIYHFDDSGPDRNLFIFTPLCTSPDRLWGSASHTLKTPQLNVLRSAEVCVCISECVCAGEGVVCIQASRDPDWPPPNWSGSGSGSSEKDHPKHSRRPNVCYLL